MNQYVIALDVGGESVKSARISPAREVIGDVRFNPMNSLADAETILAMFARIIAQHIAPGEPDEMLLGVALAFPGPFDYPNGICLIQHTSHSGGVKYGALYGMNMREALRARLNRPALSIVFRNDAEAAILGEALYGAGKPFHRAIGITLGTGLGSAFLIDGKPQTSGPGVPENGWLYCKPFIGAPAGNGATDGATADDIFSTRGLLGRLSTAGMSFANVKNAAAAAINLPQIQRIFAEFGADLGAFLEPYAQAFGAEAVLILGGIANAWDLFAPALQERLTAQAWRGTLEARAALIGAAEFAWQA